MLIKELLALRETKSSFDFKEFYDELDYNMESNEDKFSVKSSNLNGNKITLSLEDLQGDRGLYYDASVVLKGNKLHVKCKKSRGEVKIPDGEINDDQLSDLAAEVVEILTNGVEDASAADNKDY